MLLPATTARALEATEVLVVVNANANGSEALGKYYCLSRTIPAEQLLVLKTTADPVVSRSEYNAAIRDPIRKFLEVAKPPDRVKCIALMWGVPVRVLGRELTSQQREAFLSYRNQAERLEGRMAADNELLKTVGTSFPQPKTDGLTPPAELFEKVTVAPPEPGSFGKLQVAFATELNKREAAALALRDAAQRQIAHRQVLALRLDALGFSKLPDCLPREPIPGVPSKEAAELAAKQAAEELDQAQKQPETAESIKRTVEAAVKSRGVIGAFELVSARLAAIDTSDEDAAVDSELALLWEDDDHLKGWRVNPMFWRLRQATQPVANVPRKMIMTARIDGPAPRDAMRIIKDSVEVQKVGLKGTFYVDAGGIHPQYDVRLRQLAEDIKRNTTVPVVLENSKSLFGPNACPNAALYVGWYSLRVYIPSFTWVKGAVGWHIASFEAEHLRDPKSNEWCPKMIQNGVAATLGAVNEPYLQTFPGPEEFFPLLLTGRFTVAECYWRTAPTAGWRMTLIADPLYNPFEVNAHVPMQALPPAMTGQAAAGRPTTTGS